MAKYISNRQQNLKIGISSYTESNTVLEVTGKVGIGTTNAQNHSLFVVGSTNITGDTYVGGASTFVGVATFSSDLYVANQLYVSGVNVSGGATIGEDIITRNFLASGISTFNGFIDVNSNLDVTGHTELDSLNVSGISTFESNLDINASIDVDGHTELDSLNVSGISTFESNVDINASVDIQNALDVFGLSSFRNNVEFFGTSNVELTWDSVERVLRFKDDVAAYFGTGNDLRIFHNGSDSFVSDSGTGNLRLISDGLGVVIQKSGTESIANFNTDGSVELYYDNSKKFETTGIGVSISNGSSDTATIYGPSNLIIDPMPIGVGTTSGIVRIKGDLYVDGTQTVINSATLEISDFVVGIATTVPNDIILDGAGIGIGSNKTFLYEYNSGVNPSLKSSENLNVASNKVYQINQIERLSANTLSLGTGTSIHSPSSNVLTLGTNNVENIRIDSNGLVGISTDNPISNLDVFGQTELDSLNVSGISTFESNVDVNASVEISNDLTVNDALSIIGLSTFASNVDINANLDVDGYVELDDVNISSTLNVVGVSTFVGVATFKNDVYIDGDLYVSDDLVFDEFTARNTNITGIATILNANVVGVATITNIIGTGATIGRIVSSGASFSQIQVSGISTFNNGPVFVGSGTTTGTANQKLQVTGGAYVSESVGLGITAPREELDVIGDIGVQASGATNRFVIQHNNALNSLDFVFV